jgi:uncharacterized protein YfaS (alpha-2-macroglobulin family)
MPASADAVSNGLELERVYLDPTTERPLTELKLGQLVKVRLQLTGSSPQPHVALVDPLPAGLEPVLSRFERPRRDEEETAQVGSDLEPWVWEYRALHDDRAEFFTEELPAGTTTVEYYARATTPGRFRAAPATAEAMYEPARNGRTKADAITVHQ